MENFIVLEEILHGIKRSDQNKILQLQQLSTTPQQQPAPIKTVALLPAGGLQQWPPFAQQLLAATSAKEPILHLTSSAIKQQMKTLGIRWDPRRSPLDYAAFANWINQQEQRHRLVIYQADLQLSSWTRMCIQQADRILLIAEANSRFQLNRIENMVWSQRNLVASKQIELVLIHPNSHCIPYNSKQWLQHRAVKRHHHVELHNKQHMQRQLRFLHNKAVGLVMGSGGFRGFAHFGVLQALLEHNIPIDYIGGSSAGAIVAALVAAGENPHAALKIVQSALAKHRLLTHYNIPIAFFLQGKIVEKVFRDIYKQTRMEDLWLNCFATACDLISGDEITLQQGLVRQNCQASSAVPGLLAPVAINNMLLVDGGSLNSLPVSTMKRLCNGPVIGVNILANQQTNWQMPYLYHSLLQMVVNWMRRPLQKDQTAVHPNILSTWNRILELRWLQNVQQANEQIDLFLSVPLENYGIMDSTKADSLFEAGYRYTKKRLEQIDLCSF
ncbi:MAG: patatin-like phospholipase family protein [Myxococcota bacterium]